MEVEPKLYRAIMVSSTFTDLEAHRGEAIDAINRFGFYPNVMEYSGACSDADVIETSLRMVRDSVAYLCVIGHKYGQTPVDPARNPNGLSITELEFNEARRLERPILLFLMADDHPVTKGDVEPDVKKRRKLEAFRKQAKRIDPSKAVERVYETFASKDEFAKKAAIAVGLQAMADCGSDIPDRAIRDAIARFIDVKPEANQAELTDAIERFEAGYRALEQQLAAISVSDNRVTALKADAEAALAEGDLDKARAAYREAAEAARDKAAEPVRTAADLKSAEAGAHLLALDWQAADVAWAEAEAMLAPFDPEAADFLSEGGASALDYHGTLYGSGGALNAAIGRWRALAASTKARGEKREAARLRDKLGVALSTQGARASGPEGLRLHDEAIAAFDDALTVHTRTDMPAEWAMTQNNLGTALATKGERTGGPDGICLLNEAVIAFRNSLSIRNRDDMPTDWAMTQANLSNVLASLGERTSGSESLRLLDEAVIAGRAALTVHTSAEMPADWAVTQSNLGAALANQGLRTDGAEGIRLLDEAVTAYRKALTVQTRADMPADWAMTQNNLGSVLIVQGQLTGGADGLRLLEEALAAYREAITVHTRSDMPADWAMTQVNIGMTLGAMAEACPDCARALLREAEATLVAALGVYTAKHMAFFHESAAGAVAQVRAMLAALDAKGGPSTGP